MTTNDKPFIPKACKYEGCEKPQWNNLDSPFCKAHTMGHYYTEKYTEDGELRKLTTNDKPELLPCRKCGGTSLQLILRNVCCFTCAHYEPEYRWNIRKEHR